MVLHRALLGAALLIAVSPLHADEPAAAPAPRGEIRAAFDTAEPIARVWAVQRQVETLTTSAGEVKDVGLRRHEHAGEVIDGQVIRIANLPVPGDYDLRLETQSGALIEGWDATVPASDYVGDPPLEDTDRKNIFARQSDRQFTAFADRVRVLDVAGNVQHAALLIEKLRWRPFVGGGYKEGEWVWRVERWHWENPMEHTWVPYQERPFYALVRERLYERDYQAKRVVYARHLGGISLTADRPMVDVGTLKLPRVTAGVSAVDAQGTLITSATLKGADAVGADAGPAPAAPDEGDQP